jgi:hypothetical protein
MLNNMEKIKYAGWVQITADDKTLKDFCYLPLKYGKFYKFTLVPDIEPKRSFLRVFMSDNTFHTVHESRFRILNEDECKQFDRDEKLNNLLVK